MSIVHGHRQMPSVRLSLFVQIMALLCNSGLLCKAVAGRGRG
jgi:hypothetical protein